MSFTNPLYFFGDINIPVGSNLVTENTLTSYIARYEPEILDKLLGYELRRLTSGETSQRMTDLIEGKEYTVSFNNRDQKVKWNGFQNSVKISLLSDYVYYWWQRINNVHTANVGSVKPRQENSMVANPNQQVGNAWHRMRELYGYPGQSILAPSAYNFLKENEDDYPEWVFTEIGQINMFGL